MVTKELLAKLVAGLAPQLEVAIEGLIVKHLDQVVDQVVLKITEAIPGTLDNVLLESAKPKIKEELKKVLLAQAEKISVEV